MGTGRPPGRRKSAPKKGPTKLIDMHSHPKKMPVLYTINHLTDAAYSPNGYHKLPCLGIKPATPRWEGRCFDRLANRTCFSYEVRYVPSRLWVRLMVSKFENFLEPRSVKDAPWAYTNCQSSKTFTHTEKSLEEKKRGWASIIIK